MFTCLIDGKEFETELALHTHIARRLKTRIKDYYQKFFPRKDLLTGDSIEFKDKVHYFSSLFNSRKNLIEFLTTTPSQEVIAEVIKLRAELKSLKLAPSTVEARTSVLPSPALVAKLGYDYNQICQNLGLVTRYRYDCVPVMRGGEMGVVVDTREQKPLELDAECVRSKLDFGDYVSTTHYHKVFIERKSMSDFCVTLSSGYQRLHREIARANNMSAYLIICIEGKFSDLELIGNTAETIHVGANPELFGARVREICQQYEHVQFVFADSRQRMTKVVESIFRMGEMAKQLDLQYCFDMKII